MNADVNDVACECNAEIFPECSAPANCGEQGGRYGYGMDRPDREIVNCGGV